MGFVIKESLKSTAISLIGAVLGVISMLFAIKIFTQPELGLQQSLIRNSSLAVYFVLMGFDYALLILGQRYHINHPKRGSFLRFSVWVPLLCFVGILIPFLFGKEWILDKISSPVDVELISKYYWFFPLVTFFYGVFYWLSGYLRSLEKATFVFFINDIVLRLLLIAIMSLYLCKVISFDGFVYLFSFSFLIPIGLCIYKSTRSKGFDFKVNQSLDNKDRIKVLDFSFFHMMIIFTGVLAFQIDGFIFPIYAENGLSDTAVYSVCIYAVSVLRMPGRVVGANAIPSFTKHYDENNFVELKSMYERSAINLLILVSLMVLLVIVNIENLQFVANEWKDGYEMFRVLVPIMLIGVWVESMCGLNYEILGVSKYYKWSFYIAIGYLILIVALFLTLVPLYGILGAAIAFSISILVFSVSKMWVAYSKLQLKPWGASTWKVIGITILIGLLYFVPDMVNPYISIVFKSIITFLLFLGANFLLKTSHDLNRIVRLILNKIKK